MDINEEISLCSENYEKWKALALSAQNKEESKKFLEKAFFWLELQSAFITLFAAEQAKGKDPAFKRKLLLAKTKLSKKLAEYAENVLNEIEGKMEG
ncbi:MAG: hypothetical protein QXL86_00060 [Candidatus Aenigmatarchaeota archaeon]